MKNKSVRILYKNSVFLFLLFTIMAAIAFWPNYYGRLEARIPGEVHFHAICMSLWLIILISQATLIRAGQFKVHRWIGRGSFLLVPLMIYSGLKLSQFTLGTEPSFPAIYFTNAALMINSLIIFGVIYALAIFMKKDPATHARYMIGTIFPILTPITDRLIYIHFPSLVPYAPTLEGMPLVPVLGFLTADIIVFILAVLDGIFNKKWDVFPVILGLLLLYHFSYLYFYDFAWWQEVSLWILRLPL